ncbi:DUF6907 domain-containing protein [Streptomyces sp. NPDC086669]|uniref:DUF6907 domain-containing protein n=1 Tax=Streptomyces sp. NPDC086669 TaxID=3365753 RepID=UPI00380D2ED7
MAQSAISQHIAALAGIPSQPPAATVRPFPAVKPGYRLVPVPVGREGNVQTAYVTCPSWCVTDHSQRVRSIEDVNHNGQPAALSLTNRHPARVPLEVSLSWWPSLGEGNEQPKLAVDLDTEVEVYDRTAALAMADQLVAFAAEVRRLAETLPDDQPVRSQADEALRRVRGEAV